MNRKFKKITAMVLTLGLVFATGTSSLATTKEEAQQQINQLQQEQQELQDRLDDLASNKADTESYILQLDEEMAGVSESIEASNVRLTELEAELLTTQANLDAAQANADAQYAALTVRIRQMYEDGDPSMLEILMKADSITTVLNSSEYISKISEYDNNLLNALNDTLKQIADYKVQLEEQKAEEENVKEQLEIQQASLQSIMDQKNAELESLGYEMSDVYHEISETNEELLDTQAILDAIEAQERAEAEAAAKAAAAAAAAAASNASSSSSSATVPSSSSASSTGFIWPLSGGYISSGYGLRTSPTAGASTNHAGVDIAASAGSAIYAVQSGTVVTRSYNVARGYYVVVSHGNGVSTLYQHCSALYANVGDVVSQGQTIAAVGSTGYSTGPHLHFEVLINGSNVNPANYL